MATEKALREPRNILSKFPYLSGQTELLRWLVNTDETVLVTGESGTGKSVLARLIHMDSFRRGRKCGVVYASTLPDHLAPSELFGHKKGAFTGAIKNRNGIIEECDGGTFIVEEVGDLSPRLQLILLDLLDNKTIRRLGENIPRPVDVRFVFTTNRNLFEEARANRFRYDLLWRILAGHQITLPPISRIPVQYWRQTLFEMARKKQQEYYRLMPEKKEVFAVGPSVLNAMRGSCPGNYRTLLNFSLVLARNGKITLEDLNVATAGVQGGETSKVSCLELQHALLETKNNQRQAARKLGISETTLRRLRRKYGA